MNTVAANLQVQLATQIIVDRASTIWGAIVTPDREPAGRLLRRLRH